VYSPDKQLSGLTQQTSPSRLFAPLTRLLESKGRRSSSLSANSTLEVTWARFRLRKECQNKEIYTLSWSRSKTITNSERWRLSRRCARLEPWATSKTRFPLSEACVARLYLTLPVLLAAMVWLKEGLITTRWTSRITLTLVRTVIPSRASSGLTTGLEPSMKRKAMMLSAYSRVLGLCRTKTRWTPPATLVASMLQVWDLHLTHPN